MKKKQVKTPKMTLDKFAIIMSNSFESLEKRINARMDTMATKEDLASVRSEMATKDDIIGLQNQIRGISNRIDDVSLNRVRYEDHDRLKTRVDLIEKKLKTR